VTQSRLEDPTQLLHSKIAVLKRFIRLDPLVGALPPFIAV